MFKPFSANKSAIFAPVQIERCTQMIQLLVILMTTKAIKLKLVCAIFGRVCKTCNNEVNGNGNHHDKKENLLQNHNWTIELIWIVLFSDFYHSQEILKLQH